MKLLVATLFASLTFSLLAKEQEVVIDVKILNSPVLEKNLKVQFLAPPKFKADHAEYKIVNMFKVREVRAHEASKKDSKLDKRELLNVTKNDQGYYGEIDVSKYNPGSYRLVVSLVSNKKKHFNCHRGHSKNNYFWDNAKFVIDSRLEVKDPGEAGKKTLLGIDSDKDGVRDDLQRIINEKFANQPEIKEAAKNYARGLQEEFATVDDRALSIAASHNMIDALECISFKLSSEEAINLSRYFEGEAANTVERVKARIKTMQNFGGQGRSERSLAAQRENLPDSVLCD